MRYLNFKAFEQFHDISSSVFIFLNQSFESIFVLLCVTTFQNVIEKREDAKKQHFSY